MHPLFRTKQRPTGLVDFCLISVTGWLIGFSCSATLLYLGQKKTPLYDKQSIAKYNQAGNRWLHRLHFSLVNNHSSACFVLAGKDKQLSQSLKNTFAALEGCFHSRATDFRFPRWFFKASRVFEQPLPRDSTVILPPLRPFRLPVTANHPSRWTHLSMHMTSRNRNR